MPDSEVTPEEKKALCEKLEIIGNIHDETSGHTSPDLLEALNKVWDIASDDTRLYGPMADIRAICKETIDKTRGKE